ncbi:hypothetical protein [Rhodococcus opacus]|uniref:Secreted protein n=1 Tax=Rhodococcus opacus (strain B4) TaxID=632772 RepID=C1B4G4_RHOOB|nr:hypothetical protein [Rhodococcus opacus]BAH55153.1 hypothetical protein ROP_69060 [Rhodococcus opacus B4]
MTVGNSVVRSAVVGSVAAVALFGAPAAAVAETETLTPTFTIGHGLYPGDVSICGGRIEARSSSDYPEPHGPNYIVLSAYFVGTSRVCLVDGTLRWRNLDTGASGTTQWALSGWDGPGAPTAVYFDPGAGRVGVEIIPSTPNIAGGGEFTVS